MEKTRHHGDPYFAHDKNGQQIPHDRKHLKHEQHHMKIDTTHHDPHGTVKGKKPDPGHK